MIGHTPSRVSYNLFFWVKNRQQAMHTRGLCQPYCETKVQIQANSPKPFRSPLSLSLSPPFHHIGYHCWNFFHFMPHNFHVNSLTSGDMDTPKIGWSEPTATNALVEDEAIQAKNTSSPTQSFWLFQPLFCPKVFPSYLPPPSYLSPTYLPFLLTSPHFAFTPLSRAWESLKPGGKTRSFKREGKSGS
jgi:hypothetical protein